MLWALAGASGGTRKTWDPDGIEYRPKPRALVALARRHDDREWPPLPVAGEVYLARRSSPTASDHFVRRMEDPLLRPGGSVCDARLRRAGGRGRWCCLRSPLTPARPPHRIWSAHGPASDPSAIAPPTHEAAVVVGLPRAVARWQVTPGRAGPKLPEYAVYYLAVVLSLLTPSPVFGQKRHDLVPYLIRQLATSDQCCRSPRVPLSAARTLAAIRPAIRQTRPSRNEPSEQEDSRCDGRPRRPSLRYMG